jgi:exo-beta-1,3-glucanase (GH17 family)
MKSTQLSMVQKHSVHLVRAALTFALTLALVACGGGGSTPGTSTVIPNAALPVTALLASTTFTTTSATISSTANDPNSGAVCVPATGLNCVVQITATSPTPGATVTLAAGQSIPFSASAQTLTLRVYASAANIPVRIRVENSAGSASAVDAQALTTTANAWQTLEFNFINNSVSTLTTATASAIYSSNATTPVKTSKLLASISPAVIDLTKVYNKVSVFFNEGKAATNETYFFHNLYFSAPTTSGQRPLSSEFLARKAINYSPFRSATTVGDATKATDITNEIITPEMVLQDLTLLQNAGFGMIRLFNSDSQVGELVLNVIKTYKLDMKVYLGMWMAGYNDAGNKAQIELGINLANDPYYRDTIVAVSVGNESMVNWSDHRMLPAVLAGHLATVRNRIKQPVTTDDNWAYYAAADRQILDNIDFASVHTYAMVDTHYLPLAQQWDWKQLGEKDLTKRAGAMMDAAMLATKKDYAAARAFMDSKGYTAMPIVIGETGWMNKDPGSAWYRFLAHPVNQKMYLDRLTAWANEGKTGAGPKNIFYFEAFDEQWKGSDDGWGLFNKNRQARYAIQNLIADGSQLKNCVVTTLNNCKWSWEAGAYTDANALKFVPPAPNTLFAGSQYTLFSDAAGATMATGLRVDAFEGNSVNAPEVTTTAAPGDGSKSIAITPTPRDYGWGLLYSSTTPYGSENLFAFAGATGRLNVWIKTAYAGKIELGLSTDTLEGVPQEAYLQIANGDYGYCTNDTWCQVSVPLQAFLAVNPKLDFSMVLTRFVIADRYEKTGKALKSNITTPLNIDGIYWSK